MSETEALKRARKALKRAYEASNHFNGGDLMSHEICDLIDDAMIAEFSNKDT